MKPTLYYAPTTCALATLIALEEAGADVEHVRLDLARGDTRHPAYLKLTPKGRVPVFVTERGVLSESPAILAWIAQTWPEAGLVPADDAWGTAQVNSFNNFLSGTLHGIGYAGIFKPLRFVDDAAAQAAVKNKAYQTVADAFEMIENKLGDKRWVHGDAYTSSDAYLTVLYGWLPHIGRELGRYPKIAALAARVLARPATQRALAKETSLPVHSFDDVAIA